MIGGYVVRDPALPALRRPLPVRPLDNGDHPLAGANARPPTTDTGLTSRRVGLRGGRHRATSTSNLAPRRGLPARAERRQPDHDAASATFDQPLAGSRPRPGDTDAAVRRREDRQGQLIAHGAVRPTPSSTSRASCQHGRRAGPARRSPSRPTTRPAAGSSSLHEQGQRPPARRVQAHRRRSRRRRPGHAPPDAHHPARPGRQPQRRPAPVRARRRASTCRPATAAPRTTRRSDAQNLAPLLGKILRIDVDVGRGRRRHALARRRPRRSSRAAPRSQRCSGTGGAVVYARCSESCARRSPAAAADRATASTGSSATCKVAAADARRGCRSALGRAPRAQARCAGAAHGAAPRSRAVGVRARDAAGNRSALRRGVGVRRCSSAAAARGSARSAGLAASSSARS